MSDVNKTKGPWNVVKSEPIYKNEWIEVVKDDVERSGGQHRASYATVRMRDGVSVLPIDNEGNVYFSREYRYAVNHETYEAITGGIEDGEAVLDAAKRELKEEAGIIAEEFVPCGYTDPFTSVIKSTNHMFIARRLSFTSPEREENEMIRTVKLSFREALVWVEQGKITHAATVILLLKAKSILGL